MSKKLSEMALNSKSLGQAAQPQPKEGDQEIIEIGKNVLETKHFYNGEWRLDNYDTWSDCMMCHKSNRLCSGGSASCPVCDGFMTEAEYQKHFSNKREPLRLNQTKIRTIIKETGLTLKDIEQLVWEKKDEGQGLFGDEEALFLVGKELGVFTEPYKKLEQPEAPKGTGMMMAPPTVEVIEKKEEKPKEPLIAPKQFPKPQPKVSKEPIDSKFEIQVLDKTMDLTLIQDRPMTLEEKKIEIEQKLALLDFMAEKALNKDDYMERVDKRTGEKKYSLTRSGCNKLAVVFGISTRTISIEVKEEVDLQGRKDIVAYAVAEAVRPNGTSVIMTGKKSLSEYGNMASSITRHILETTAETRAHNRATQNAIGFVPKGFTVVTKEEMDIEAEVESKGIMMGGAKP